MVTLWQMYFSLNSKVLNNTKKNSNLILLPRYLALEGLCLMSNSEFSVDAVRKHQETVVSALKVSVRHFEW